MIVTITGHTNIEKAVGLELEQDNGIIYNQKAFKLVYRDIVKGLLDFCELHEITFNDLTLVSGMARGVDEVFAFVAINNNLKLILSIPASIRWHKHRSFSRNMRAQAIYYDKILQYKNIIKIHEISKSYGTGKHYLVNLARNQHMVDISDSVFCYKSYDSTGTDDCIKRAKLQNKFVGNLAQIRIENKEFEGFE